MKFSVNQNELQNALATVSKGTSTKSTLPILSGIFIEAKGDSLILQATDLELSIQCKVNALVDEEGKAVVPGKLFFDIVKNMNDAAVTVTADTDKATINCDSTSFEIRTLDPEDFPSFPKIEVQQQVAIPFETFSNMVKHVAKSVSKDESKMSLTGINVVLEGNKLSMVTTDSYRLALTATTIENDADDFQAIISSNFMANIVAMPKTDECLTLALAENQIVITYQDVVFINRRIEGSFPAYKRIIPTSAATKITLQRNKFIAAARRANLLGTAGSSVKFEIDMPSKTMQISSTQDTGSLKETIPFEGEGESIQIGFNCTYIVEGLSSIDSENIDFELNASNKAGVFKVSGSNDFLYLIMPMRI